jgi:hypothetical protein
MKSRAIFEKMSKISQEAEKTQITNIKNESIHLIVGPTGIQKCE